MLWGRLCWVRVSLVYRGRALPVAWRMLPHRSARVRFPVYRSVLEQAARMLPPHVRVLFLADRGFGDTALMAWLQDRGWSWRLRVKGTFRVYHPRKGWRTVQALVPGRGRALCLHGVFVGPQDPWGPVHLAVGWPLQAKGAWCLISNEPTSLETFAEYARRMHIEAEFLDEKSNGFQLQRSVLRGPQALDRLGLVLAATTLFLVAQGVAVVEQQARRQVDPHWDRSLNYLKIGWRLKRSLVHPALTLIQRLLLAPGPDPCPAIASRSQAKRNKQTTHFFHGRIVYSPNFVSQ